jgi:CRP-like cAMP-binding protein
VSKSGKEGTIAILNEADFFGESCLAGQPLRMCSATAVTDCMVMRIEKKSIMEVIRRERAFSQIFVAYLLTRNIRYEADLVDQLFNSSEKDWLAFFSYWLISARTESPKLRFPRSVRKLSQRWWARPARESISS